MDVGIYGVMAAAVLTMGLLVWQMYNLRRDVAQRTAPIILPETIESVVDGAEAVVNAATIASQYVGAAEQLWLTGKLPRESRFDWVYERMLVACPGVDRGQLIALIEGAVYWLKVYSDQPTPASVERTQAEYLRDGGRG